MLYKFKSRAAPDLIMLEAHARRVLQIVGKFSEERRGIIQAHEMPIAIAALEAAITAEEAAQQAARAEASEKGEDQPEDESVHLRQRAAPFIEMMRRCMEAQREIVWGI
jgi:hypothetical protein